MINGELQSLDFHRWRVKLIGVVKRVRGFKLSINNLIVEIGKMLGRKQEENRGNYENSLSIIFYLIPFLVVWNDTILRIFFWRINLFGHTSLIFKVNSEIIQNSKWSKISIVRQNFSLKIFLFSWMVKMRTKTRNSVQHSTFNNSDRNEVAKQNWKYWRSVIQNPITKCLRAWKKGEAKEASKE